MAETRVASPQVTQVDQLAPVHMREIAPTTQINLRVDPKSTAAERIGTAIGVMLPNQPGEVAGTGELSVLWLGPDEWLLVGPAEPIPHLHGVLDEALDEEFGAVTDVSAYRTIIEISGPRAREVLAKGCAIDLHPRSFRPAQCVQTLLARAQVVLVCWDGETPRFWLMARSSFARYVTEWLADAASEYGGTLA